MSSNDNIDDWLAALRIETRRLQFRPYGCDAQTIQQLKQDIQWLECRPLSEVSDGKLDRALHIVDLLKQDLAFVERTKKLFSQVLELRAPSLKNGIFKYDLDKTEEILDGLHACVEKIKMEQRHSQWRHLASLQRFWPEADLPRRKKIVHLLTTYSGRRFVWGFHSLRLGVLTRIGGDALRMAKRW